MLKQSRTSISQARKIAGPHTEGDATDLILYFCYEALFFVQHPFVAEFIGNIRQGLTQNFAVAPRLKPTMHGFVVRIALRQHVPLRASVENSQDCFEHAPRRNRFASGTTTRNVFLRKMIPNALPMLVAEPNHPTFIADRAR